MEAAWMAEHQDSCILLHLLGLVNWGQSWNQDPRAPCAALALDLLPKVLL